MNMTRHRWLPVCNPSFKDPNSISEKHQVDYVFKIADSTDELLNAYKLLYHEYLHAGYIKQNKNKILFTKYHLLPKTTVFVAKFGKFTVSTATLVRDSKQFGLPMDDLYRKELHTLRNDNRKIVEVGSLASNKFQFTRSGIQNFTKLLFLYCVFIDTDDVCVMVNPKHVPLYKRLCDLEIFGEEKFYPKVNATAVALRADVRRLRQKLHSKGIITTYRDKLDSHYFSLKIGLCSKITDILKNNSGLRLPLNPLDTYGINHILSGKSDALQDLSMECINMLKVSYPGIRI
jgi:hypothetical protein